MRWLPIPLLFLLSVACLQPPEPFPPDDGGEAEAEALADFDAQESHNEADFESLAGGVVRDPSGLHWRPAVGAWEARGWCEADQAEAARCTYEKAEGLCGRLYDPQWRWPTADEAAALALPRDEAGAPCVSVPCDATASGFCGYACPSVVVAPTCQMPAGIHCASEFWVSGAPPNHWFMSSGAIFKAGSKDRAAVVCVSGPD